MDGDGAAEPIRHEGVTIARDRHGELVARKTAPPGGTARLMREVAVLRLLRGLAVPACCDPDEDGSRGWIDLRLTGSATLADAFERTPSALAAGLAATAQVLDAAHRRGVSHGRLTAEHILLGSHGAVVLTGWADAGLQDEATTEDGAHPSGTAGVRPYDPAGDVAALGELAARAASADLGSRARTRLNAVAAAARHPDPALRPPMAELARVLALTDVDTRPTGGDPRRVPSASTGRRLVLAAVTAAAVALGMVAALTPKAPRESHGSAAADRPTEQASAGEEASEVEAAVEPDADTGPTTDTAARPGSGVAWPETTDPASGSGAPGTAAPARDTTAAAPPGAMPGCPADAAELAERGLPARCRSTASLAGETLTVGRARYALGGPSDQAGLSDPTCTGRLSPVVLLRSSGQLYLYDRWAGPGDTVAGRLAGSVTGAIALADPDGNRCGTIAVLLADGSVVDVAAEPR